MDKCINAPCWALYVYDFRPNHLASDNELKGLSLGETISSAFRITKLSAVLCLALCELPLLCWHVYWWCPHVGSHTVELKSSCYFQKTESHIRFPGAPLALTILSPHFCDVPEAVVQELCCRFSNWGWTYHNPLFSLFWSLVVFCSDFHLASLMRGDSYNYLYACIFVWFFFHESHSCVSML